MKLEKTNALGKVYFSAWIEPDGDFLYVKWDGEFTLGELQLAVLDASQKLGTLPYTKIMQDAYNASGAFEESIQFLMTQWLPQARARGIKHFAMVKSKDVFTNLSMDAFEEAINEDGSGMNVKLFDTPTQAVQWMQSVN
jgi:hypothetical protein